MELSVVVPTYQEAGNVGPLVAGLHQALVGRDWEVLFVDDDSPDGTWRVAEDLADDRVRVLRRVGRRGLATAVMEGVSLARGAVVVVMDGDLQHQPADVIRVAAPVLAGVADVGVGSRYAPGGSATGLSRLRTTASRRIIAALRLATGVTLRDPMTGFFAVRRDAFAACAPRLIGRGYKILLDLLLAWPGSARVVEVPIDLGPRGQGSSKMGADTVLDLVIMVVQARWRRS